jgi:hypothetical protein
MNKQSYSKPELIVHGDVEQITQQAGAAELRRPAGHRQHRFPAHIGLRD